MASGGSMLVPLTAADEEAPAASSPEQHSPAGWLSNCLPRLCRRRSIQLGSLFFTTLNLALLFNFIVSTLQHPFAHLLYKVDPYKLPEAEADFILGDPDAVSFYQPWLREDLDPWREEGVTHEALEQFAESKQYRECWGEVLRFQIINGSLWVDHISERHKGWYPAELGEGAVSGKGKIPYAILSLLDTLRHFPGQIPDLDAYIQTSDFPCIKQPELDEVQGRPAIPLFGYSSNVEHRDIPFPDYTYWGHEYSRLTDRNGYYLHGWTRQHDALVNQHGQQPLVDRRSQVVWRGRTEDARYPERDALRREFVKCGDSLRRAGRANDAKLFDDNTDIVQLYDNCKFRYPIVLESGAWTTNMKQKLSCGSILLSNKLFFYDFFTRALKPGVHFVEVDSADICNDVVTQIRSMEATIAAEGRPALLQWNADYDKRRKVQLQLRQEARQEQKQRQEKLLAEEIEAEKQHPDQHKDVATLLHKTSSGTGSPTQQAGARHSPAQEAASAAERHRQLHLTTATRAQHGLSARRMLRQKHGAPGLVQRMHRMQAEVAEPMKPWEIAKAGQEFVGDHLGMADVRLYIRDVLREYAALQVFDDNLWTRVQPSWNAVQYSGDLLLQQFAYPYRYDFEVVRAAYPWLHSGNATSLSWILDEMLDGTAAAPGAAPLEQSSAASNSSNPPTSSS